MFDHRKPDDMVGYLYNKYGNGFAWGFVEELATKA